MASGTSTTPTRFEISVCSLSGVSIWVDQRGNPHATTHMTFQRSSKKSSGSLASDPDVAASHPAIANEPCGDQLGGIDGDRDTDGLGCLDDSRVDADDLAARVDERSAGVARIEGGVRLNHVLDLSSRPGLQRAAQGAHN